MLIEETIDISRLNKLIEKELTPFVRKIDQEAYYAKRYIERLGEEGFLSTDYESESATLSKRIAIVEETAKVCMTTAFCVWCHLAAITYLSHTSNEKLCQEILPQLLSGKLLGGTGLSNPLKTFAKLEKLHLKARKVSGGYVINGALPAVSNIGVGHSFAFIAGIDKNTQIMGFTSCDVKGLSLNQRTGYLGLNGSATFSCSFKDVFIPDEDIISTEAHKFVEKIRNRFVSYQVPLGLGVTASCIDSLERMNERNFFVNQHLRVQPEHLKIKNDKLRSRLIEAIYSDELSWQHLIKLRLEVVYVTLEAVQTAMIYHGGRGYVKTSSAARKLREAYFLVNLTPTVKHLEKIIEN